MPVGLDVIVVWVSLVEPATKTPKKIEDDIAKIRAGLKLKV